MTRKEYKRIAVGLKRVTLAESAHNVRYVAAELANAVTDNGSDAESWRRLLNFVFDIYQQKVEEAVN